MIIINFSHPLTNEQKDKIKSLTGSEIQKVIKVNVNLDNALPFGQQVEEIVEQVGLTGDEWQIEPILVNLPGYAPAVGTVLAELHGRMGNFPSVIRLAPVENAVPRRFEVAEMMNLNSIREAARKRR